MNNLLNSLLLNLFDSNFFLISFYQIGCYFVNIIIVVNWWLVRPHCNTSKPESTIDALRYCTNVLPNVKLLLQLFATLPVTSATPERTFSTLKLSKNYLRSTMNEERINGLAMAKLNKSVMVVVYISINRQKIHLQGISGAFCRRIAIISRAWKEL